MKKSHLSPYYSKKHLLMPVIAGVLSLLILWCAPDRSRGDSPIKDKTSGVVAEDRKVYETARFIAGRDLPSDSSLNAYATGPQYQNYKKRMSASWARLQEGNSQKIVQWKEKHIPKKYTPAIFYPFSGPDIINALLFFPDGTEYIMFGLESPGSIPRAHDVPQHKLPAGLSGLGIALDNVLNVNYFKTLRMEREISTNSFNSITSVIMFFLSRMEYEVLSARHVWIDGTGVLVSEKTAKRDPRLVTGVELLLRKGNGGSVKRVRYFQLNVIDNSLKTYTNFIPYLETYDRYTTIIKSASYLMHNEQKFTKIRTLTLSHSDYILQDDSGVALRFFDRSIWKLSFHGVYTRPVPLFAHRYQADFAKEVKEKSTGPLPFSYGYNFGVNRSNLMFAERIKK